MTFRDRAALVLPALLCLYAVSSVAQTPAAAPPAVPADVSPLYVVTYVEARPAAGVEAASLLKSYRDASGGAAGNLRAVGVRSVVRPGQFVVVAAWKDKAGWDAHRAASATKEFREKLNTLRTAPADDRFHNSLSVGPMDVASGSFYGVPPVDVIPPQKDNAIAALKVL